MNLQPMNLQPLFKKLKIRPKDEKLYESIFTHSTYVIYNQFYFYENLEFLGDSIIDFLTGSFVYQENKYNELVRPRYLTDTKHFLRSNEVLKFFAKQLELDKYLLFNHEFLNMNNKILADVFESLIGVIFLEKGIVKTQKIFNNIIHSNYQLYQQQHHNYLNRRNQQIQKQCKNFKNKLLRHKYYWIN